MKKLVFALMMVLTSAFTVHADAQGDADAAKTAASNAYNTWYPYNESTAILEESVIADKIALQAQFDFKYDNMTPEHRSQVTTAIAAATADIVAGILLHGQSNVKGGDALFDFDAGDTHYMASRWASAKSCYEDAKERWDEGYVKDQAAVAKYNSAYVYMYYALGILSLYGGDS